MFCCVLLCFMYFLSHLVSMLGLIGLIGYLSVPDPSIVTLKARDKTCGCLCDIPLKHTWYRLYYNKHNRLRFFF